MKIDRILAGIRESQAAEKTASEATSTPAPAVEKKASNAALVNALNEALAAPEKTASEAPAGSPVNDVMKVAAEIAQAEQQVAVKEAQLLGAAFADAAVARMAEWNKTAAAMLNNAGAEKMAAPSDDLLKQAAQMGYEQAKADLEKQAEESYVKGYNDTVEAIHKTAAEEFLKAAAVTANIIKASVQAR